MSTIDPKRFAIGVQFRHDHGGSWEITRLEGERLEIKPMPGTTVKHRALLLGRNFKIFGKWFKIEYADSQSITLRQKPSCHAEA